VPIAQDFSAVFSRLCCAICDCHFCHRIRWIDTNDCD